MKTYMDMEYTTYTRPTFMVNVAQLPSGAWLATVCRRLNPGPWPVVRYGHTTATTQPTKYQALRRMLQVVA